MALAPGQSEVDSVTVRFPSLEKEIKTWDTYSVSTDFSNHVSTFQFSMSTDSPSIYNLLLIPGAKIEILSNNKPQLTGYIDRVSKKSDRSGGLVYNISGKDILGPVVGASLDPQIKITSNQTVADLVYGILGIFGIKQVYIGDDNNYQVISGYLRGQGGPTTRKVKVKEATSRTNTTTGKAEVVYTEKEVTEVISRNRKDLKAIPLDQRKPHIGDGAMQVIDRFLKRLGLHLWAAADGSGVVIDAPNFETKSGYRLVHQFNGSSNNVINASLDLNAEIQPSAVIAKGGGGGGSLAKASNVVIAVNELVAVDPDTKAILKSANDLIARYPKARVLPLRDILVPKERNLVGVYTQLPIYVKDDESKTIDQLAAATRRRLSNYQAKYLQYNVTVKGHTYNGQNPWAVNTLVRVDDDYLGVHEHLWVQSRTFQKSRSGGTTTQMVLIKPYTYVLGDN